MLSESRCISLALENKSLKKCNNKITGSSNNNPNINNHLMTHGVPGMVHSQISGFSGIPPIGQQDAVPMQGPEGLSIIGQGNTSTVNNSSI